jgi:competence protein ComEA
MKRPTIEHPSAAADAFKIKDKQVLVLFLLGTLLLSVQFLPQAGKWAGVTGCGLAASQGQWQVWGPQEKRDHLSPNLDGLEPRTFVFPTGSSNGSGVAAHTGIPVELALFFNRPLPINASSQKTLEMLPGVGPRLAAAIVTERQRQGRFADPESLLNVPGIGPNNLQKLLPLVSFQ